ncbi:MAG: DUF4349 domain-containing protein [Lachnospiraceae bacterium]|nr:DUF4349 domain-containing protein [Lachnospiraceae bacterium]
MKKKSFICAIVALTLTLAACGSSEDSHNKAEYRRGSASSASAAVSYSPAMENGVKGFADETAAMADTGFYEADNMLSATNEKESSSGGLYTTDNSQAEILNDSARKRIVNYNLNVETEDFDNLLAALQQRVNFYGGYFESIDTNNGSYYYDKNYGNQRYSYINIRIPSNKAEEFVNFVGENANITSKGLSSQDITLNYVDTESKRNTYKIELERLLALLEKAETIEDIITLEDRIAMVRYKLESMESQLRTYDNLVDYTQVYLYISEVKQYTEPKPETFGEKISKAFKDGWRDFKEGCEDFAINFVNNIPGIIIFVIFAAVGVTVIVIVVKKVRRKLSKSEAKALVAENSQDKKENNTNNGQ